MKKELKDLIESDVVILLFSENYLKVEVIDATETTLLLKNKDNNQPPFRISRKDYRYSVVEYIRNNAFLIVKL